MINQLAQILRGKLSRNFRSFTTAAFWVWLILFYWAGVVFYDYINSSLNIYYTDEALVSGLVFLYATKVLSTVKLSRNFLYLLFFILSYLSYSLYLGINNPEAILSDLIVASKSPLALVLILAMHPVFSRRQWALLKINAIAGAIITLGFILAGEKVAGIIFQHPSRLATTAILSALLYLASSFSSKNSRIDGTDLLIFTSMMSLSLPSERAKAYGFFVIAMIFCIYFYSTRYKNNPLGFARFTYLGIIGGLFTIYAAIEKITFYFIQGVYSHEMFARPALYITSLEIAKDYFPFGAGLASFASYYSGVSYSPLYVNYGIDRIFGLSQDNPAFISDTFFPMILGQFGFFGIFLLIFFVAKTYKAFSAVCGRAHELNRFLLLGLLIIAFCIIESIADSTMVQNRGIFVLALLSLTYISAETESTRLKTASTKIAI